MNVSGGPVGALAKYFDISAQRIIVVHDDVDLLFDTVRLKFGGGEGGHNGLRSITGVLGTKDYLRVRVGVGRPAGRQETSDHVLSRFSTMEVKVLPALIDDAADATQLLIETDLRTAQQKFHAPR
jgi:PTH1 family peptidyl-tRNA hydrolase